MRISMRDEARNIIANLPVDLTRSNREKFIGNVAADAIIAALFHAGFKLVQVGQLKELETGIPGVVRLSREGQPQ